MPLFRVSFCADATTYPCHAEERSDAGPPEIRYELRDMRYEIWRIFTLQHNDPHCRSEERSDEETLRK